MLCRGTLKEINPVALSIVELCWLEASVNQSVSIKFCTFRISYNDLEGIGVDLKASFYLKMFPSCHEGKLKLVFRLTSLAGKTQLFMIPNIQQQKYYHTL